MQRAQRARHRVGQHNPAALQVFVAQAGKFFRISLALSEGAQDTPPAHAQQIADHRRQLNTPLLQEALDLVLQMYPLANQLQPRARRCAPAALLRNRAPSSETVHLRRSASVNVWRPPDRTCVRAAHGLRLRQMQLHPWF
jgi:hypothetical protein